jgi:type I restriction enzyme, S subunit
MKNTWRKVPLSEACLIRPPKQEARQKIAATELVSFLPMEDLGTDQKLARPYQSRILSDVAGSYTYFAEGDVLLAKITPCFENGKLGIATGLTNGVGFGSSEYIVLRPQSDLSSEWLYYYLLRRAFRDEGAARMSGAVGHRRVAKEFVESYPIPIPAPEDQRRITNTLDTALADIEVAERGASKSTAYVEALFEGYLDSLFVGPPADWTRTTLGTVARFIDYRGRTPKKTTSGLRLITAKNVKMGYVQRQPEEFVAPSSYEGWMTRGIPNKGDVLFTTEAPLANVAQLDTDERVMFAQRIIVLQPDATVLNGTFLKYLLLSKTVQRRIHAKGTGATATGIKASLLKTIEIAFPPTIQEQESLAEKLDRLRAETLHLKTIERRKLERYESLREAVLSAAFANAL